MTTEELDKTCQEVIEVLYRRPEGLGFNDLAREGPFNKVTLRNHLDRHLIPRFVEATDRHQGKKSTHKLTEEGVSTAFKIRSQNHGKLARSKWAQEWLNECWEPIDVTNLIIPRTAKTDMVYLMRNRKKKEAKIIVPPYLDGHIYLHFEDGRPLDLVPGILSKTDIAREDSSTIVSKVRDFIKSNKLEAIMDPGPVYKRFLGTLKQYVSLVRYAGGPIPFSKEIQHQEVIEGKFGTNEQKVNFFAKELLRDIENPPKSGICFVPLWGIKPFKAHGFWVILNPRLQNLLKDILRNEVKARKFRDKFLAKLEPFIENCLVEVSQ